MPHDGDSDNRIVGVKISDFVKTTTIDPATSIFTYVSNGQNFTIGVQDLFDEANVTGSIVQAGDPANFPVLVKFGDINAIRNLAPGVGISMADLPAGDIEISVGVTEGGLNTKEVTQTQSFALLAPLRFDFSLGTPAYVEAQADSETNANVEGVVIRTGATEFIIATTGYYTVTHGLAVGDYFLDASAAGGITLTPPKLNDPPPGDNFERPLFRVFNSTEILVFDTPATLGEP